MIKQLLKKVLIIYLVVIACVFTPTYRAYAASAGGWAFSSFDVAKSVVTAMKNGASASVAVAKSPITSKIAKGIVGGVIAGAALPLAISQISGLALNAVDWVLDPANNAIKYRDKTKPGVLDSSNCSTQYWGQGSLTDLQARARSATGAKTLVLFLKPNDSKLWVKNWGEGESTVGTCSGITEQPQPYSTIPIPTVADKIYDNAKTDSASASVVNQAVKEYVNEGSADTALDAAKADADATHNCGTGTHWSGSACVADTPTTPSTPTDTPFDPSSIIDAINSVFNAITNLFDAVMSIPDVINTAIDKVLDAIASIVDVINLAIDKVINAITDFFQWVKDTSTAWKDDFVAEYKAFRDWVKAEPTPENPTKPDVTTLPTPPTDSVDISFDGGCPAPEVIAWSLAGQNVDMTISYTPICDTATLLNPIIKLAASLGAVFIIAGIRRGDDG